MKSRLNSRILQRLKSQKKFSPSLNSWLFTLEGKGLAVNIYGPSPERKLLAVITNDPANRSITITPKLINQRDLTLLYDSIYYWAGNGNITTNIAPKEEPEEKKP